MTGMASRPPERIDVSGYLLRPPAVGDAEALATVVLANLDHLSPWMPWATQEKATVREEVAYAERMQQGWADGSEFAYLLTAPDGGIVGGFGLHRRIGPGGIEIGYWLAREATGQGLATAGARALTEAGLDLDDVERLEIHCDVTNLRSAAVPQRLGYRLTGTIDVAPEAPAETGRRAIWVYPPA
jgi:RimJ/RimL family protein N-acetyltransferase